LWWFVDFARLLFLPTFILFFDSLTMKGADMFAEPVITVPRGQIKGLTRQDEADMAEHGKRQRFNVSAIAG
jgi:hypothetical protein